MKLTRRCFLRSVAVTGAVGGAGCMGSPLSTSPCEATRSFYLGVSRDELGKAAEYLPYEHHRNMDREGAVRKLRNGFDYLAALRKTELDSVNCICTEKLPDDALSIVSDGFGDAEAGSYTVVDFSVSGNDAKGGDLSQKGYAVAYRVDGDGWYVAHQGVYEIDGERIRNPGANVRMIERKTQNC